ncbi:M48 family metallopeptidase [Rhodoplanes sp. Z2-YC6860]|uniref:M48 family metallopeptidase n=1 Tax=Rhodoplanes sp. Z2-YC6860 TaxID=674703 RepID=UPI00078D71CB|nr:M48 family metallopeptidase [Rhodoplanes sp. Z2-YC6860]AMN42560.1 peptidase M48, Ste24p [Rhodoplanes sp. Z2-YC6860]
MDVLSVQENQAAGAATAPAAIYFDGKTNRKRPVTLRMAGGIEIVEQDRILDIWPFGEVRRADGPPNVMRLACITALPLARLEISDEATRAAILTHCVAIDATAPGRSNTLRIVFWSLAAFCSIVGLAMYGIPLAAERLAPLVPYSLEKRIGDAADGQIRAALGGQICTNAEGQAAFAAMVEKIKAAGELDMPLDAHVLSSDTANAMALPGGRVYLLDGLLQKANSPDEIAAVIAHELGHVKHRDNVRRLIQTGGTSFLFGLLFGDVTGAGVVIMVSRELIDASHSREAERGADDFAIDVMHKLGRSPQPMGEFLLRITGEQRNSAIAMFASHPLSEDRLETMKKANRPNTGPAILSDAQWRALKNICKG